MYLSSHKLIKPVFPIPKFNPLLTFSTGHSIVTSYQVWNGRKWKTIVWELESPSSRLPVHNKTTCTCCPKNETT